MAIITGDATDGVRTGLAGRIANKIVAACAALLPPIVVSYPAGSSHALGLNKMAEGIVDALNADKVSAATQVEGGSGGGGLSASRLSGLLWASQSAAKWDSMGFHQTPIITAPSAVVAGIGPNSAQFAAQTGNVNAQAAGVLSPQMVNLGLVGVAGSSGPKLSARIMVTSNAGDGGTRQRRVVGISDGDLSAVVPLIGSAAQARKYVALMVDVAVSPNWILMSGDGTNHSGIDTGIPVVWADTGKGWVIGLDWTNLALLTCTIQPVGGAVTTVTKATNLATGTLATPGSNAVVTQMGPWVGGVNTAAVAHNYWISRITFEGEADSR